MAGGLPQLPGAMPPGGMPPRPPLPGAPPAAMPGMPPGGAMQQVPLSMLLQLVFMAGAGSDKIKALTKPHALPKKGIQADAAKSPQQAVNPMLAQIIAKQQANMAASPAMPPGLPSIAG